RRASRSRPGRRAEGEASTREDGPARRALARDAARQADAARLVDPARGDPAPARPDPAPARAQPGPHPLGATAARLPRPRRLAVQPLEAAHGEGPPLGCEPRARPARESAERAA